MRAPRAGTAEPVPDLSLEAEAGGIVVGIDEAGRGPWAGPVVAAAVVIDVAAIPSALAAKIDDSKKLPRPVREEIAAALTGYARIGIGAACIGEISDHNVLGATFRAMNRAMTRLRLMPDLALVDGNQLPPLPCAARAVIGGDGLSLSIAAASIVAKVTRDRLMARLALRYPGYGWEHNAGYGTPEHQEALARLGITPHHRLSWAPIRKMLSLA